MRRPFAFLALALLFAACAKEEPKKEEKPASSDDDDDGKKKDKKAKKEKKGDDEEKRDEEDTGTPDDGVEDVKKDDGPPPPALCAPANDSPLGAKPKLLSSAGQPNASVAVWAMAGAPVVGTIAVTLSADKKCYVSAANGKGEKTGATVAFRVAYSIGYRTPVGDVEYVSAPDFAIKDGVGISKVSATGTTRRASTATRPRTASRTPASRSTARRTIAARCTTSPSPPR